MLILLAASVLILFINGTAQAHPVFWILIHLTEISDRHDHSHGVKPIIRFYVKEIAIICEGWAILTPSTDKPSFPCRRKDAIVFELH